MENKKELRNWLNTLNLDHPLVIAGPCSAETEDQVLKITEYINSNHKVEGDIRRDISLNIKRLVDLDFNKIYMPSIIVNIKSTSSSDIGVVTLFNPALDIYWSVNPDKYYIFRIYKNINKNLLNINFWNQKLIIENYDKDKTKNFEESFINLFFLTKNNKDKNLDLKKYFVLNYDYFSEKSKKIILENY